MPKDARTPDEPFRVEEATIEELHAAIRAGRTTCVDVVQSIHRARARLQRRVQPARHRGRRARRRGDRGGARRSAAPLPHRDRQGSAVLPDLDTYAGPALEYGRMEATASDAGVWQQFGMIVGKPNAGQLNALATLNIRGERSVTCRGDFDRHPSAGPLPPGAPPVCEMFRQLPDALERAAELDATYGTDPDLEADADVRRGVLVQGSVRHDGHAHHRRGRRALRHRLSRARPRARRAAPRTKGAIIFAKAVNTEYNGRAGDPGGRHRPDKVLPSVLGYQRSTWGGNPAQPLRHHALGVARVELRVRRVGQRQPRDGEPRRGDAGVVSRAREPQRGGADPAAQGDARLQRRRHRRGHLLRSHRHPVPHDRGLRQGARCPQGSGRRLLRRPGSRTRRCRARRS